MYATRVNFRVGVVRREADLGGIGRNNKTKKTLRRLDNSDRGLIWDDGHSVSIDPFDQTMISSKETRLIHSVWSPEVWYLCVYVYVCVGRGTDLSNNP